MTITLPEELERFVARQLERGLFSSPADVVRVGLELLREQEWIDAYPAEKLQQELAIGIAQADRGELTPFDPIESLADIRRRKAEN